MDELPAGISGLRTGPEARPLGRASAVGVVARAWVETGNAAPPTDETGDIRRVDYAAQGSEALGSAYAYEAALRSAARRAGEAIAERILGNVEPASDPM